MEQAGMDREDFNTGYDEPDPYDPERDGAEVITVPVGGYKADEKPEFDFDPGNLSQDELRLLDRHQLEAVGQKITRALHRAERDRRKLMPKVEAYHQVEKKVSMIEKIKRGAAAAYWEHCSKEDYVKDMIAYSEQLEELVVYDVRLKYLNSYIETLDRVLSWTQTLIRENTRGGG